MLWKRAALAALGLIVGVLAAEAVARTLPAFSLDRFRGVWYPPVVGKPGYLPDPVLGYVHAPNAVTSTGSKTDSRGFVGPERPLKKPEEVRRVLLLGDSIVEGGAFAAELERLFMADGAPVEIWNAGVAGWGVVQYSRFLETRAAAVEPDYIFVGLCLNDFAYAVPVIYPAADGSLAVFGYAPEPLSFRAYDLSPRLERFLSPRLLISSALYRALITAAHARLAHSAREDEHFLRTGKAHIYRMSSFAKQHGVPLAAVVFPYLQPEAGPRRAPGG